MTNKVKDPVIENMEALHATYKSGQKWQFKNSFVNDWTDLGNNEPGWFFDSEYRLKPGQ